MPNLESLPPNFPDIKVYPPNSPVALGSELYPWSALDLNHRTSPAIQLRQESMSRKAFESKTFFASKHDDCSAFNKNVNRYCDICSEHKSIIYPVPKVVQHNHFSSLRYRIDASTDRWGQFFCPNCRITPHSHKSGTRYPILLTSSTLNNWHGKRYENGYDGDLFHLDSIGIPGAKIEDLIHALSAEYGASHRPLDVLLCAGLNDIRHGLSAASIMSKIKVLANLVETIEDSTIAVCTLPIPPSMSGNYNNMGDTIIQLNHSIKDFNNSFYYTQAWRSPQFHTWGRSGIKLNTSDNPRNLLQAMPRHRSAQWREEDPNSQLHLSDATRLRMGKAVLSYFANIYEL